MFAWSMVIVAAIFEVVFAFAMKGSHGFSRLAPSALALAAGVASIVALTQAMKTMPVTVAYPVWTALGGLGTVLFGAILLGEPFGAGRMVATAALIAGVVGLQVTG